MRPEFDSIKDFAEFSKYYWYRDELIKICKAHGLNRIKEDRLVACEII